MPDAVIRPWTVAATVALLVLCVPAAAHVTLSNPQTTPGSYYKAVFNVSHGCKGSPTVKLRIRIPDGVISVKPQPKAGWVLETVPGNYAKPHTLHGAQITSGVQEVSWTGSLSDAYFDEFSLQAYVTPDVTPGTALIFPVVQDCEQGVQRWIDVQESSATPAPRLKILAK